MFSSDLTGKADKTSRFTTSTLQNDDLKSRMAKKIFNQPLKPNGSFQDYSSLKRAALVWQLHYIISIASNVKIAFLSKMLWWLDLRYSNVIIDGD